MRVLQGVDDRVVDLVNEYGQPFRTVPWSTWRGRNYRPPRKAGYCFSDAWRYASRTQEPAADPRFPDVLRYVEGFVFTGRAWIAHAWCVDDEGRVVDPTWNDAVALTWGDGREPSYIGIPLDLGLIGRLQLTHEPGFSFMVITRPELHGHIRAWLHDGTFPTMEWEAAQGGIA